MKFFIENIWLILTIFIVVFIGGGWILFTTGAVHRLADWLNPTSDKYISAKMFCEDKQIRDRRLKVGRYVVSDIKKCRSFYLVHDLLLTIGHKGLLAITERNARPIDFRNRMSESDWKKLPTAQRVFIDTTADIRSNSAREASKNMMAQTLSIMALSVTVVVVILGVIVFFQMRGAA